MSRLNSRMRGGLCTHDDGLQVLEPRLLFTAVPLITEFLASNDNALADEDGASSDWIELHNAGDTVLDLDGWYLTDNSVLLDHWQFPAVSIDPGEYLLVFASGKDRAVAGSELHTNFSLNKSGEYLALVESDASTVAFEYTPTFPAQHTDIAYGLGSTQSQTLINPGANADILVPTLAGDLDPLWNTPGFIPGAGWTAGPTGIGFDTGAVANIIASYDASLGGPGVAPDPVTQGGQRDVGIQTVIACIKTAANGRCCAKAGLDHPTTREVLAITHINPPNGLLICSYRAADSSPPSCHWLRTPEYPPAIVLSD